MPTDYSAILRQIDEGRKPKPDYTKGCTAREWQVKWGHGSHNTTFVRIRAAVADGRMIRDMDWRCDDLDSKVRKKAVYRWVGDGK